MGDNLIYQLIYDINMPKRFSIERSPTLDTVLMVEKTIDKYGGEFNRTQIWKKLPRKVMWQTYVIIIDYLLHTSRIATDRDGKLCSIWNPKLAKKLARRKETKI